ncbi:hypothetical protein BD770DRAFT_386233 [Pilaira anomala]|nr:hypothetical protein BD770DRAFT_386233 [Pilaira anomala]
MIPVILGFVAGALWQVARADQPETVVVIEETTSYAYKGKKSHATQPIKTTPINITTPVNTTTTTERPTEPRQGGSTRTQKRNALRRKKKAREAQETEAWVSSRTTTLQTNSRTGHVVILY